LVIKVKQNHSNNSNGNGIPFNSIPSISCSENLKSKIEEENSSINLNHNLNNNSLGNSKVQIEIYSKEIKELPGEENKESGYLHKTEDTKKDN
jgi:hypothetical protein